MGVLHKARRVGPPVGIFLIQFSAFSQVVRTAGIIDQPDGEDLALVL